MCFVRKGEGMSTAQAVVTFSLLLFVGHVAVSTVGWYHGLGILAVIYLVMPYPVRS